MYLHWTHWIPTMNPIGLNCMPLFRLGFRLDHEAQADEDDNDSNYEANLILHDYRWAQILYSRSTNGIVFHNSSMV